MKVITLSIVCTDDDANFISNELNECQLGIYSLGIEIKDISPEIEKEVYLMVPSDILKETLSSEKSN